MPLNPLENMPASLTRQNVAFGKYIENFTELKMNGRPREKNMEGYMKFSPCENLEKAYAPCHTSPSTNYHVNNLLQQQKVSSSWNEICCTLIKLGNSQTIHHSMHMVYFLEE